MNSQNLSVPFSLQELLELFDLYRKQTDQLLQYAKQHNDEKAIAALLRVKHRLHQGPVRALVLGASSAGKSTLINALAGDIVTPEGEHTTSPIPVWVYNRQANSSAQICLLKKNDSDIQEDTCGLYKYIQEYCYTAQEAGQGNGQERFQDLIAATANLSSSKLANYGITLIDTPGSGVSSLDNQRAQNIIRDGCELLLIVAKNFQNQDLQAYFQQLLIPSDAPFHSLLGSSPLPSAHTDGSDDWDDQWPDDLELALVEESDELADHNRIFMIVNCFENGDYKTLQADTENQVRMSLPEWDHQGHLFVLNARDARYHACGYYPHCNLLPGKYSAATWDYATKCQDVEKSDLKKHAQQAKDWAKEHRDYPDATATMEQLCDALCQAADALCQDPEARGQLLAPIHQDMSIAIQSLEMPILKAYQEAEELDYEAPAQLLEEAKDLRQRSQDLKLLMESARNTVYSLSASSENKWPLAKLPKKIYTSDYILMADSNDEADRYIQKVIAEENSPQKLTLLIKSRLVKRQDLFCEELDDPDKNPEIKYWQDYLSSLFQKLREYNALSGHRFTDDTAISQCEIRLISHFETAKKSGRSALKKANLFQLSEQQKEGLIQYLIEKREKICAGNLKSGWVKFWLWPNLRSDWLIPTVDPMLQSGWTHYMTDYRQHLNIVADDQIPQLQTLTDQILKGVRDRLNTVEQEIADYKEKARRDCLDQIQRKLDAVRAMYSSDSASE